MIVFQPFWIAFLIILCVSILGYLRVEHNRRLHAFFQFFYNSGFANLLYRERFGLSNPISSFLSVVFILIVSLFCIQINLFFVKGGYFLFDLLSLFIICLLLLLIYTIKILFLKLIGFIIQQKEIISEYLFNIILINQGVGIFLIPVVIFLAYGKEDIKSTAVFSGIIIIAMSFIFRIVRGLMLSRNHKNISTFYLFLYLCAFEFLPLLLGIKLFIENEN
ncbi:MAG: DUF4271 domain-containing protein [Bacteroidota bacterium]